MFTYFHKDKELPEEAAATFPVIVFGSELTGRRETIRVFQSNAEFSNWADETAKGDQIREVLRIVESEVPRGIENDSRIESMQRFALERANETFNQFARLLGREPKDEEVIRQSITNRALFTPKLFDPMFFYDRIIEHEPPTSAPEDQRTQLLFVPSGFWPNLGWYGWNDKARSCRVFGLNILCENTGYRGRWAWLLGFNMLLNLRWVGFDGITSSVISF